MSLVSDYNKVADQNIDHPVFNELFSAEPRKKAEAAPGNDPGEWFHVITADPTQARSVLYSRLGESYIIQGPPGTGKSQTITNLIADFLARDKTVLFVCEKRAALDVVYHRLQQNHLSELCCYIHDSQGDKKEFFKDLRTIYEDFLKNKMDLESITIHRKNLLSGLLEKIDLISQYHSQQKNVSGEAGVSTRKLMENLVALKKSVPKLDAAKEEMVPVYSDWLQFGQTIQQLATALESTGADPKLSEHPFSNLGTGFIRAENPFGLMESLVTNSFAAMEKLSQLISREGIAPQHATTLENIKNLVMDSVLLESLAQTGNLQLVKQSNPEAKEFEQIYNEYKKVQQLYAGAVESSNRWKNKFDRTEVELALQLAHKHERSFFSFLNGDWRRLKKQLMGSYDFVSHQVKPSYSMVLNQLKEEYLAKDKVESARTGLQSKYHLDNIDTVYVGIDVLRRKQGDQEIDYLLAHPRSNELVIQLSKLNNTLQQLELQLKTLLYGYEDKSLLQIKDEIATISSNAEVLKDLLPSLRRFADLPVSIQLFIRQVPLTPLQAEAVMANKTLDLLFRKNQVFSGTSQQTLRDAVSGIEQIYKDLLKTNSDYIRAVRRRNFLKHYETSTTAASQLNAEQKLFKTLYSKGRQILEHEMNKTMRYKSIREMASNESGHVLKDIKPVWLMSPLSVSDSLPLDSTFFDVVIFDEASQIALEEGIPALYRAPQTIIVGDDKQMPPSNFFNAKAEDPEDLELIEGETEEEILSADADSLLVQGSRKLNSTMLSWHYRSRYETLISYSNHAFYEAALLTIPDRTTHHLSRPLLEVSNPEEGAGNTSVLLKESMSYHYLPNGVYEARGNIGEARYIAAMVRTLLLADTQETIGIVAFSQEQQGVIEEAIDGLAVNDRVFDEALEKAYNRKDDGQFTGLFVKNLENVQGDERDIIIMSVCYGFDANKKMLMNFGPINRKGGEKRLNVIFSRAKKHMAVVSSIRHNHITNDHNDGANYFKRFLHYSEMVATGNLSLARTILDGLVAGDQLKKEFRNDLSVTTGAIKKALEAKGYVVDEQIGQSNFKCSLGVKKNAIDDQYLIGILVDDSFHYENDDLVEQYYQRPAILEAFGWKVMNVFAKDWLANSGSVLDTIVRRIEGVGKETKIDESSLNATPDLVDPAIPVKDFIELYSPDGLNFWKIHQDEIRLEIHSGKVGHRGMVQVKSFSTPEEAANAKNQMLRVKTESGFQNTPGNGLNSR
ncbi:MAG: AAA domain-containing protein [Chitinophagaceae bacterium]